MRMELVALVVLKGKIHGFLSFSAQCPRMRISATKWALLFIVFIELSVSSAMLGSRADGSLSTLQVAYRRPAALTQDRFDSATDPIWTLGRTLFFDPDLAASRALSCGSCHRPDVAWTDHLAKAHGESVALMRFRTPTLINVGYQERFGWEGRFPSIADIAFIAISSPLNMNMPADKLLNRIEENQSYATAFKSAFPDGAISRQNVGAALTRYVASITGGEAPFDRWIDGDAMAISTAAAKGFALFNGKAACSTCHSGWTFTDSSFHDVGIAKGTDLGRGARFQSSIKLQYAFKTPTLRNVAERAPYMHDGSLPTLAAVIEHYDQGGIERPSRDPAVHPLHLTASEKADLVAFLLTLSGPTRFVSMNTAQPAK